MGDVELEGEFTGVTKIKSDTGDIEIYSALAESLYTIEADIKTGELDIGEIEFDSYDTHVTRGNGDNLIKIISDIGDVEIGFKR